MHTITLHRFLSLPIFWAAIAFSLLADTVREAVIPFDTPDPTAIESADGKGVYVFATGRGIQILYTENYFDWDRRGRVFEQNRFPHGFPDWAKQAIPGAKGVWAPDIVRLNDRYYVYYSVSTFGGQRSVIGLASNVTLDSASPDYQWTDEGIVLESHPDHTDYNAIDSALFQDDDGRTYLFWGSYWTGLKAVEVDPKTGKPLKYVDGELKIPADYTAVASRPDTSIEAPYVVRHGDYYYLFTSRGSCCDGVKSTYHIAVGRAVKPLGPYVDKEGKRMDQGGGTVILSSTEKWKGTGHNGFFRKGGKDWLILAAYNAEEPKKGRLTQIRPLNWDEAGWPVPGEILSKEGPKVLHPTGNDVKWITKPTAKPLAEPVMKWADTGKRFTAEDTPIPYSKDPTVVKFKGRYLMYFSLPPSDKVKTPYGWIIGIAESSDLVSWKTVAELPPMQQCDAKGLCAPCARVWDGKVHLFYQTYGNGKDDAICYASSEDGLKFTPHPENPVFRPRGDWTCGRAIDADVFEFKGKLFLYAATRDPDMKIQKLVVATADPKSDLGPKAWTQAADRSILEPELPWETRCIEASTVCRRGDSLVMFYAGGYNNDPQQIGVARSGDGVNWTRLWSVPFIPNGPKGQWNSSESGHPGVFVDDDGRTYLFYQGNPDRGKSWFLSVVEIGWKDDVPFVKE